MTRFQTVQIGTCLLSYDEELKILFTTPHSTDEIEMVKMTNSEYRLMMVLISGEAVSDGALFNVLPHVCPDMRVLEKYIDTLRSKVRPLGLFIRRITRYGYLLMAEEKAHQDSNRILETERKREKNNGWQ